MTTTTAPRQLRTDPDVRGVGRPVMAAIDPDDRQDEVVALAISQAQPDGFVVLAAAFPPRPVVSHDLFPGDLGPSLWRVDKALPREDIHAIEQALELLDRSGVDFTVVRLTRPEALLRRSRRRLAAEALAEVAARHGVESIVVGPTTKSGRTIASYLRELTDRPVVEAPASATGSAHEGGLVDFAVREAELAPEAVRRIDPYQRGRTVARYCRIPLFADSIMGCCEPVRGRRSGWRSGPLSIARRTGFLAIGRIRYRAS